MLQDSAKGKMLLSPTAHEFAGVSMHVLGIDLRVFAETEIRRSSIDAAFRLSCDSSTRTINLKTFGSS